MLLFSLIPAADCSTPVGPAQANARSANDVVVLGTNRSPVEADLRQRLDSDSATDLHSSIRYSGALLWIVLYVRRTQFVSHPLWNREPVKHVAHVLCDVVILLQTTYDLCCSVHD